jgi:ribonucleoside-diphosphate reductase alpha chain
VQTLSLLITAILRRGGDIRFLTNELMQVHSAKGGASIKEQQKYRPSVVAAIGGVLEEEFRQLGVFSGTPGGHAPDPMEITKWVEDVMAASHDTTRPSTVPGGVHSLTAPCPECGEHTLVHEHGCERCTSCDYTTCG